MISVAHARRSHQQRLGEIEEFLPVAMIKYRRLVEIFLFVRRENAHSGHKLILSEVTENQIREIDAAGFAIEPHRIVAEAISGSMAIAQREGFSRLLNKMEKGDVLIVTKLDRLGRDAIDVSTTAAKLEGIGIRVHCLALGGVDLTSSAGKMTMNVINAVAQFERELLIERTQSGLARAKASGKPLGRPSALSEAQQAEVKEKLQSGETISDIARQFETSRQTIMRIRAQA